MIQRIGGILLTSALLLAGSGVGRLVDAQPPAGAGSASAGRLPVDALKACKVLDPSECPAFDELARGGEKSTPLAVEMLTHEDARVRRVGARLLTRAPSADAGPTLVRLLDDTDPDVRADALDALGMTRVAVHARAVVALLGHEKAPAARVAALRALGRLGSEEGLAPLVAALEDTDHHAVLASVRALGALGDRRAVVPVAALLVDPRASADVQEEAARTLARLKDPRVIPNLVIGSASVHVGVKRQAILALGILNATQAIDLLVEALADDTVLREATLALGNIDDPRTLEPLLTVMRIEDLPTDIRASVVQALGRRKVGDAVPELMTMLRDVQGPLSVEVVRALGAIGDARAIARLVETLRASDPAVVGAANSALQQITGQRIDPNPDYWNQWLAERDQGTDEEEEP